MFEVDVKIRDGRGGRMEENGFGFLMSQGLSQAGIIDKNAQIM